MGLALRAAGWSCELWAARGVWCQRGIRRRCLCVKRGPWVLPLCTLCTCGTRVPAGTVSCRLGQGGPARVAGAGWHVLSSSGQQMAMSPCESRRQAGRRELAADRWGQGQRDPVGSVGCLVEVLLGPWLPAPHGHPGGRGERGGRQGILFCLLPSHPAWQRLLWGCPRWAGPSWSSPKM